MNTRARAKKRPARPGRDGSLKVGQRIKQLRLARRLTLNGLARRAGVAVSFLSGIEAGTTSPSVASLQKILEALNVHVAEFFQPDQAGDLSDQVVFRRQDMKVLADRDRNWRFTFPSHPRIKVVMTHEQYRPRTRNIELESHPGDICGLVLKGRLTLEIVGKGLFTAETGDAFYLKEGVEHRASNRARTALLMVVVQVKR